jgi:hypothetical protein
MPDNILQTIDSPLDYSPPSETPSSAVWAVSLAFWITLLIAASMYGCVALAPRLFAWIEIRHDFLTNAHQLQALESEVDYLERVRDALKSDPEFVQRMAEASIAEDIGEAEVIPVSGTLIFGSEDQLQERMPEIEEPVGALLVQQFATDRQLRHGLLVSASLMIVFAFTVLNGTGGRFVSLVARLAFAAVRLPLDRYRRADPVVPEDDAVQASV